MITTVTSIWETTPDVTPLISGVLDHATIHEGIAWGRPIGMGTSFNCLDTGVPTTICPTGTVTKTFNGPATISGFEFAVYGGLKCKPFGFDEQTGESGIAKVFALKETRGVERALMETRFVLGPDDDPGVGVSNRWPAADDITPAVLTSARVSLAILEGKAVSVYAGQPTLHIPYTVAALLAQVESIVPEGGKFYTTTGAKVVVGAGYEYPNNGPTGAVNTDLTTRWMYATGEVVVARSEIVSHSHLDQNTNDIFALAERRYIVATDCPRPIAIKTKVDVV